MWGTERRPSVRKIAVVRANGIGDYVFSVPALMALRKTYPDAEIVLLGRSWHAAFLAKRPGPIDRVVTVPHYPGVGAEPDATCDTAAHERFFAEMRAEHFDLALQMHGGGRYSNPFTRRLGARYAVGLRDRDAEPLDRCVPYLYFQPEVLRYLEVVSLVGAKPDGLEPRIALTEADRREVDGWLGLPARRPLVVVHPGATDLRRRWPAERFGAVAHALHDEGAHVVVSGDRCDGALAAEVVEASGGVAVSVAGRLSLGGLAALLARSRVVVGNDSGPLHLAAAVGARTVGIYWVGNFINGAPLSRMHHRPLASWRLDCAECGRNTLTNACEHRSSFVADVPLEDVKARTLELYREASECESWASVAVS
jgi:ADP-heptose:LPS heptosyltransferase